MARDIEYEKHMKAKGVPKGAPCPECKAETYKDYVFCDKCGHTIDKIKGPINKILYS